MWTHLMELNGETTTQVVFQMQNSPFTQTKVNPALVKGSNLGRKKSFSPGKTGERILTLIYLRVFFSKE